MRGLVVTGVALVVLGTNVVTWSFATFSGRVSALRQAAARASEVLADSAALTEHRADPEIWSRTFGKIGGIYNGANERLTPAALGVVAAASGLLVLAWVLSKRGQPN